jgi:hypothetical protein
MSTDNRAKPEPVRSVVDDVGVIRRNLRADGSTVTVAVIVRAKRMAEDMPPPPVG